MTALTLIGGYLGAGKTTLLNHLLATCDDRRLGVVVNDFGAINIDASLIASRSDSRINLTNGCICCGMSDGFHDALEQLMSGTTPPDHIVVEASGVADVQQLAQYGHMPGMQLDGVLVVADAETVTEKVNDRYVGATVRRQLAAADLLVLNKIDLLHADLLGAREDWLRAQYPHVQILSCKRGRLPLAVLLGVNSARQHPLGDAPRHEHYESWHVSLQHPVSRQALEAFSAALDADVLRAKGTVGVLEAEGIILQVVGRRKEVSSADLPLPVGTHVVAIGLAGQLDRDRLNRLVAEYLSLPRHAADPEFAAAV